MNRPLSIERDFVVLSPEKKVTIEHCDLGLYSRLDATYKDFAGHELISSHEFTSDWPSWEIHPFGDEVVILLSGKTTLLLQLQSGEIAIELSEQGQYAIVPKGVWHTAKTPLNAKLLFITPGQGTQNKVI